MVTQVVDSKSPSSQSPSSLNHVQKTKTLICALNLLSRDLPLPPEVFDSVSSIYHGVPDVVSPSSIDNSPKSNKVSWLSFIFRFLCSSF